MMRLPMDKKSLTMYTIVSTQYCTVWRTKNASFMLTHRNYKLTSELFTIYTVNCFRMVVLFSFPYANITYGCLSVAPIV